MADGVEEVSIIVGCYPWVWQIVLLENMVPEKDLMEEAVLKVVVDSSF